MILTQLWNFETCFKTFFCIERRWWWRRKRDSHVIPSRINIPHRLHIVVVITISNKLVTPRVLPVTNRHIVFIARMVITLGDAYSKVKVFKRQFDSFSSWNGDHPGAFGISWVWIWIIRTENCTRRATELHDVITWASVATYSSGFLCVT